MFYGTLGLFRKRETPYSPELGITLSSTYLETPFVTVGTGGTEYLISKSNNDPQFEVSTDSEYLIAKTNNTPNLEVNSSSEYVITKNIATIPLTISG